MSPCLGCPPCPRSPLAAPGKVSSKPCHAAGLGGLRGVQGTCVLMTSLSAHTACGLCSLRSGWATEHHEACCGRQLPLLRQGCCALCLLSLCPQGCRGEEAGGSVALASVSCPPTDVHQIPGRLRGREAAAVYLEKRGYNRDVHPVFGEPLINTSGTLQLWPRCTSWSAAVSPAINVLFPAQGRMRLNPARGEGPRARQHPVQVPLWTCCVPRRPCHCAQLWYCRTLLKSCLLVCLSLWLFEVAESTGSLLRHRRHPCVCGQEPGQSLDGKGFSSGSAPRLFDPQDLPHHPLRSQDFPLKGPAGPVPVWGSPNAEPGARVQTWAGFLQNLQAPCRVGTQPLVKLRNFETMTAEH